MMALSEWQNFYVIVGSSAGALIGLQFVVLALIAAMPDVRRGPEVAAIFATPTTVYFGSVLFLAAAMSIPWRSATAVAIVLCAGGMAGVLYSGSVAWRLRAQSQYKPEAEDWWFHAILPALAYCALLAAAGVARFDLRAELFGAAAAALLLLIIGIHNAWDTVTYHVFVRGTRQSSE